MITRMWIRSPGVLMATAGFLFALVAEGLHYGNVPGREVVDRWGAFFGVVWMAATLGVRRWEEFQGPRKGWRMALTFLGWLALFSPVLIDFAGMGDGISDLIQRALH